MNSRVSTLEKPSFGSTDANREELFRHRALFEQVSASELLLPRLHSMVWSELEEVEWRGGDSTPSQAIEREAWTRAPKQLNLNAFYGYSVEVAKREGRDVVTLVPGEEGLQLTEILQYFPSYNMVWHLFKFMFAIDPIAAHRVCTAWVRIWAGRTGPIAAIYDTLAKHHQSMFGQGVMFPGKTWVMELSIYYKAQTPAFVIMNNGTRMMLFSGVKDIDDTDQLDVRSESAITSGSVDIPQLQHLTTAGNGDFFSPQASVGKQLADVKSDDTAALIHTLETLTQRPLGRGGSRPPSVHDEPVSSHTTKSHLSVVDVDRKEPEAHSPREKPPSVKGEENEWEQLAPMWFKGGVFNEDILISNRLGRVIDIDEDAVEQLLYLREADIETVLRHVPRRYMDFISTMIYDILREKDGLTGKSGTPDISRDAEVAARLQAEEELALMAREKAQQERHAADRAALARERELELLQIEEDNRRETENAKILLERLQAKREGQAQPALSQKARQLLPPNSFSSEIPPGTEKTPLSETSGSEESGAKPLSKRQQKRQAIAEKRKEKLQQVAEHQEQVDTRAPASKAKVPDDRVGQATMAKMKVVQGPLPSEKEGYPNEVIIHGMTVAGPTGRRTYRVERVGYDYYDEMVEFADGLSKGETIEENKRLFFSKLESLGQARQIGGLKATQSLVTADIYNPNNQYLTRTDALRLCAFARQPILTLTSLGVILPAEHFMLNSFEMSLKDCIGKQIQTASAVLSTLLRQNLTAKNVQKLFEQLKAAMA